MNNSASLTALFMWVMTISVCLSGRSSFVTLRVRLPSGSISRLNVTNDISIGELCERVGSESYCIATETTAIRIGEHASSLLMARSNATKLIDIGIRNGDLIELSSESATKNGGTNLTKRMRKNAYVRKGTGRRVSSLADLEKQRADMVKITRELPDDSVRVVQHAAVQSVLERLSFVAGNESVGGSMALLVGRFANSSSNGAVTAEVSGAFDVGILGYDAAIGLRDSESLLVGNALLVAEDLGLDVIGVALGTSVTSEEALTATSKSKRSAYKGAIKSSTGSMWRARHVHSALQVRASSLAFVTAAGLRPNLVRDPFLVLSAARESTAGALQSSRIRVEAFRLSAQALQLHSNGSLPAVPTRRAHAAGDEVHLSITVRGIAGADDSAVVDCSLLCVPVAITSAATAKNVQTSVGTSGIEMEHAFPSLAELQCDPAVAEAARQYLLKLLGRATEALRAGGDQESSAPGAYARDPTAAARHDITTRLRDPQLLLYLSTVMEQPIFRMLCRHLRWNDDCLGDCKGAAALPIEVLVALEQARQSLL